MNSSVAESYYIAYRSIDLLESIVFFYNYLLTWSIGIFFSLIIPILFLFAPSSFRTARTSNFAIICLICLSNMLCIYTLAHMLTDLGELNLSFHVCRFIVYLSTFAKPMGLYLTLLFSIERLFSKNLLHSFLPNNNYRNCVKGFYLVFIVIGICSILSLRLYEVLNFITNNPSIDNSSSSITEFKCCYRSLSYKTYGKILSFYTIQYWFEYVMLAIICLILLTFIIYQYVLPFFQQRRTRSRLSVNTKFYLCLSSCVVLFEFVLLILHFLLTNHDINNSDTQVRRLQAMLFIYNLRCILLPFLICLTTCDPLKDWVHELIIVRPYTDNVDESDQTKTIIDRPDIFSSSSEQILS